MNYVVNKKRLSPFSLARGAGWILAPTFLKKYMQWAMGDLPEDQFNVLKEYIYQVCLKKGSGEYALNVLFEEVIFAKNPIMNDIDELWSKVDVSFFYGTRDWMNLAVKDEHISTTLENYALPVYHIEDASHHLYIKNPEALVESMVNEIGTEREGVASPMNDTEIRVF
jgi:cardiolipin-specific phospholipase